MLKKHIINRSLEIRIYLFLFMGFRTFIIDILEYNNKENGGYNEKKVSRFNIYIACDYFSSDSFDKDQGRGR